MARFGTLGTQYFDNSGDVLSGGLIYFYEPSTTTPKTTYSDISQTTPNTAPVVLDAYGRQPNVFFTGGAKAVLKTSAGVTIDTCDPCGDTSTENQFLPWISTYSYEENNIVLGSDGTFYKSLVDGNLGNNPISSPTYWSFFSNSLVYTPTATTSGTSKTYGSLPVATRIVAMLNQVSISGTASIIFRLGTGGALQTSSYVGSGSKLVDSSIVSAANFTTGFGVQGHGATNKVSGSITFNLMDSATNTWIASGVFGSGDSPETYTVGGVVALSGALDIIGLTTTNGTDTFDNGSFNISVQC